MNTPIVLIIFNRPELTQKVFDAIKIIKPTALFVIADGSRNKEEHLLVNKTREIINQINWPCKVYKKYSDHNLGRRKSVSEGLNWVFSKVESAIILEDDCLPDKTFFKYCEELLEKFKSENTVMMISGNNFFDNKMDTSYAFCRHSLIWGWATWRRAWAHYKNAETNGLNELTDNFNHYGEIMSDIRLNAIKKTLEGKIDTWDYVWQMAILMNNGFCAYPSVNLVKNIGFGAGATHTKRKTFHSKIKTHPISFPLAHPKQIKPNTEFDDKIAKSYHPLFLLWDVLRNFILR